MGNNCSCLNNITSLCSEDLSRANNNDIMNNNDNKIPSRNINNNEKNENYETFMSINDTKSINSTNTSNLYNNKNPKNKKINIENSKNTIDNTTETIKNTEISFINPKKLVIPHNEISSKLQKYILRIIIKRKFLKNIKTYKEQGNKLFKSCMDNINKSHELLIKAESFCKIKYNKTSYKLFYENISKEEENNMHYIPPEITTIDDSIIINYNTENENNINDIKNINWIYKGQININSIPNGFGLKYNANGIKEEGYFKEGELKGWGQIIDYKGNIIMGLFDKGKVSGRGMKYSYLNNTLYKGDLINNNKEGKGEEINNENTYIGNFLNDKKNGKGKLINNISGDIYDGNFKDDLFDGEGHYIYKISGQEYRGEYKNGLMHGKGIYEWSQGEYYKGNFINGKKEGYGEMHWADGRSYIGPFINGRPQGVGIYDNGINYKGELEFINGKINRDYLSRNYEGLDTNSIQSSEKSSNKVN